MAARTGQQGLVQYKGVPVFRINSWNLDINVADHDVTVFTTGTVTFRSRTPGLVDGSGSFSGFWDMDGSTAQKDLQTNVLTPATGTVRLEADKVTGGAYSFDAILSQTVGAGIDDDVTVAFNYVSNGAITYSTTT